MDAIERGLKGSPTAQPDPAIAEKLASQEREIQQLRSLLQQQARAMQEHQPTPPPRAETADATRWQALVKERDSALATLKKQTISQHRAMNRQISELQAELAEKDAILANLQTQIRQAGSDSNTGPEGAGPSPDANEREHAREEAGRLVETLTQTLAVHQQAIEKHREEAERLAQELHVLAAALQALGQSLSDQAQQMSHMGLRED
jgi:hypothetical protein